MDIHIVYIVYIAYAFGLGAIPFGMVWTRLFALGDVRKIGSGNIGATNVLRTGNKLAALLTLVGDLGKGVVAAILPLFFTPAHIASMPSIAGIIGIAVVIGHCYSPLVGFKGGKGVATGIGVMLGFVPIINLGINNINTIDHAVNMFAISGWLPLIILLAVWFAIAMITRYSSLAAILGFATLPIVVWYVAGDTALPLATLAMSSVIIWRHRANIARLLKGEETKIGG